MISASALAARIGIARDFRSVVRAVGEGAIARAVRVVDVVGEARTAVGARRVDSWRTVLALVAVPLIDAGARAAGERVAESLAGVVAAVVFAGAREVALRVRVVSDQASGAILRGSGIDARGTELAFVSVPRVSAVADALGAVGESLCRSVDRGGVAGAVEGGGARARAGWVSGEIGAAGSARGLEELARARAAVGAGPLVLAAAEASRVVVAGDVVGVRGATAIGGDGATSVAHGEIFESGKAGRAGLKIELGAAEFALRAVPFVRAAADAARIRISGDLVGAVVAVGDDVAFLVAIGVRCGVAKRADGAVLRGVVLNRALAAVAAVPISRARAGA